MPFEKITHTKINAKTGQPLSKSSVNTYKAILNQIALTGIETKQQLLDEHKFVIDLIESIHDSDTSEDKDIKRRYYSAVFYALDEYPAELRKPYYDAFIKCKEYKK